MAIPNGREARGSAIVFTTALVAGSMTLMESLRWFVTQTRPLAATAMERGAVPTATSANLARVTASNALTLSLSWFTTQILGLPLAGVWRTILLEPLGLFAVAGRYTVCRKVRVCTVPLASVTLNVTLNVPGLAKVWLSVDVGDHAVSPVPSPKFHRYTTFVPPWVLAVKLTAVPVCAAATGGSGLMTTPSSAFTVHTKEVLATLTPSLAVTTTL